MADKYIEIIHTNNSVTGCQSIIAAIKRKAVNNGNEAY